MKAVIKIVKQGWTGWVREQPKPEEQTIEIGKDGVLDIIEEIGQPSVKIKEVNKDSVIIITSHLAPGNENGGIDLKGKYSNFETTIREGETVEFDTQTMDAGTHYTLALLDIN